MCSHRANPAGILRLTLRACCAQEYQFRNIAKAEWANLLAFLKEKPMRIVNFDEAAQGPGGGRGIMDFAADDIDAGAKSLSWPLRPLVCPKFRFGLHNAAGMQWMHGSMPRT